MNKIAAAARPSGRPPLTPISAAIGGNRQFGTGYIIPGIIQRMDSGWPMADKPLERGPRAPIVRIWILQRIRYARTDSPTPCNAYPRQTQSQTGFSGGKVERDSTWLGQPVTALDLPLWALRRNFTGHGQTVVELATDKLQRPELKSQQ